MLPLWAFVLTALTWWAARALFTIRQPAVPASPATLFLVVYMSAVLMCTLFGIASLGCAVAPGLPALIAGRALQAAGAAVLMPTSLGLALSVFPAHQRGTAVGVWAGVGAVAAGQGATYSDPSDGGTDIVLRDSAGKLTIVLVDNRGFKSIGGLWMDAKDLGD